MALIKLSLGTLLLAGQIKLEAMRATAAIRRYLKAIDEPDRPVIWACRESDIVTLLAGTSARGVASLRTEDELMRSVDWSAIEAAFENDLSRGNYTINPGYAALHDLRAWRVVSEHLGHAGLPPRMCDEPVLIAVEGIIADQVLRAKETADAPKDKKRLARMVAASDAAAAGAWAMWLTGEYVVAIPRPEIRHVNFGPHAEDGPAINFRDGMAVYAWNGIYVAESWIIQHREQITPEKIVTFRDEGSCLAAVEIYGWERFVVSDDVMPISDEPGVGRLFRRRVKRAYQTFSAVEVINSAPEPDGSHRRYVLSVPDHVQTAREAVAWTFGLEAHEYQPDAES